MNNDKKIQSSAKSKSFMRRCLALLTCIGMLGSFMMPYQGVLPVIAEDGDAETVTPDLVCGLEEHTHTEECYSLICTDDSEGHEHNETCYELVCGLEEHQHDNNCYETVEDISDESLDVSTASTKNVILAKAGGFDGKKSTKKQPSTRTDNNNNLVNATGGSSYFTETVNEVGPSTREVKDSEIQNVTVTIQGTPYSAPDKDGNDVIVTLGEMNQDAVEANFSIQYMISKNEDGSYPVNVDSPCIYYQLPDGVKVPEEYYGRTRYVSDPNYNGPNGHVSGYFSINESGLIVIQFTEDYIKNKIMLSDFFEGSIKFDGTINRDETQSGDREIAVGGLALQIPYTDKTSKVEKTSTGTRTTSEGMEIDWQIKVKNVTTPADISGYLLKDSMFKDVAVTFEPSDAGSFNSDGDFVFDDAANYVPEITFTYTQTVASEDINQAMLNDTDAWSNQFIISKNTAQLINGEQEVSSGEKTIYGNKPYLEKEGEESYKNGQWIKSTIYWSIDVKAPDGDDLNGYYIIDDALNTSIEQANKLKTDELKDANGHVNSVVLTSNGEPLTAGTHYTYDATSGKITFTGTYTEVNIAYVTNCHDVEKDSDNKRNVRNDVSLYHPDKPDAPIKTDGTSNT